MVLDGLRESARALTVFSFSFCGMARRVTPSHRADPGGASQVEGGCFSEVSWHTGKRFDPKAFFFAAEAVGDRNKSGGSLQFRGCDAIGLGMDKETVIRTLRAHEAEFRAEGISHVYLFGSVARGEADETSDVDLFYDYDPNRFGFLQFMRIRELAPEIVGQPVDIVPRDGIHPLIRSEVEQAAIEVF